jgi:hypothetical protein
LHGEKRLKQSIGCSFLFQAELLTFTEYSSIETDRVAIAKMLNSIVKTAKENV